MLWTSLDDRIGYSTPVAVTVDGVSQIVVLRARLLSAFPKDGKEYWRTKSETTLDANVATPVGSGNKLFISSGYEAVAPSSTYLSRTASRRPRSYGPTRR